MAARDDDAFDRRVVEIVLAYFGQRPDPESVMELQIAVREEFHGARPYIGSPERLRARRARPREPGISMDVDNGDRAS
jgi:hypothetical protein